ncbi:NIPSNAP family protein [Nonomuraea sp. FMUSA5-5]|uniref:NIPSNAP family protein n=1 Tax=Nonomuraea composti TaxID=2720023 RepID=A0ABX1BD54_9ACTN|nr:NIPSNAP family protein [Nonomuraea sp. FMUSA5-5]NJP94490.1 NIPSNAP family protein [Nonomuraea sp. FMUSA5-5]
MIYELRRYTLLPGRRDTLISLFEREFIEAQEATGMRVPGSFREVEERDKFTWLRAFPDMTSRKASLESFYGGPVWQAHRDAANATMADSDDVLLLRPAGPEPAPQDRPPVGAPLPSSLYVVTVYHVDGADFAELFRREALPVLEGAGVTPVLLLETEPAENTFPRLPVRSDARVFVWLARFETPEEEREVDLPMLEPRCTAPPERLRLRPTARSAMR